MLTGTVETSTLHSLMQLVVGVVVHVFDHVGSPENFYRMWHSLCVICPSWLPLTRDTNRVVN